MASPGQPAVGGRSPLLPVAVLLVGVVLANAAVVRFAARERTLYSADHVAYWAMSASLAEALDREPLAALAEVVRSVDERELNLLPATPVALVMTVFGTSRAVYLLAVLNLYALPALVALALLVARLAGGACRPTATVVWATTVAVLLVPAFWWPLTLGYLDVGGLVLCFAAVALYLVPPLGTSRLVAVGGALALAFLFRRWYAFWSVACGAVVAADAVAALWRQRDRLDRAAWRAALRPPLVVGTVAVVAVAAMAPHLVLRVVATDYADRFAAYKIHATLAAELAAWRDHLGALALAAFLVALVGLGAAPSRRRLVALLALQLAVTFALLRRVQDPSPQHWYLYLAVVLPVVAWGLVAALAALPTAAARRALVAAASVVAVVSTGWSLAAPAGALAGWLPGVRFAPQVRDDLDEVRRLLACLDRLVAADPGHVYVLGSTPLLSDTSLAFANLSLGAAHATPGVILQSAHMDLRDGFPQNLLVARYVVVSDPVQCRRPADGQQVVAVPAAQILAGRGLGAAFERWPERFVLDGGVNAYVYRRARPSTADEVAALSAELRAAWPERPFVFAPPGAPADGVE